MYAFYNKSKLPLLFYTPEIRNINNFTFSMLTQHACTDTECFHLFGLDLVWFFDSAVCFPLPLSTYHEYHFQTICRDLTYFHRIC